MVRGTGFEPAVSILEINGLRGADSPYYAPTKLEWAEWVEITGVWPSLPASLRGAVLAIVRSFTSQQQEGVKAE